jgi:DNA-binding response OmpR family regulator
MKIIISTDDGEVIEIIRGEDIGDLSKPMARADLLSTIQAALAQCEDKEQ